MKQMHRVLCCGGRNFSDFVFVNTRLNELRQVLGDFAIIHGGARGADRLAGEWGKNSGLPVIEVAANWSRYGNAAGSIRNGWMLDLCFPTYAVAFSGGTGTADMVRKCKARHVPVWVL
jgi:hypothetical protein